MNSTADLSHAGVSAKDRSVILPGVWLLLVAVALITVPACMTQEVIMPEPSETAAPRAGSPTRLIEVRDVRSAAGAGSAGLVRFTAGAGLNDYLRQSVVTRLNAMNFAVVDAPASSEAQPAASGTLTGKMVRVTLVSADTSTPDALLARSDAEVRFAVEVLGPSRDVIFQQHYSGSYLARLDFLSLNPMKAQGILLARAIDSGVDGMFSDPLFIKAVQ